MSNHRGSSERLRELFKVKELVIQGYRCMCVYTARATLYYPVFVICRAVTKSFAWIIPSNSCNKPMK